MKLVPGGKYPRVALGQGVPDDSLTLVRAQHDPDWWVLIGGRQLALIIVDVHLHLPQILVRQLSDLQVQKNKGPGESVIEYEINEEMLALESYPLLSPHEGEAFAKFKEELLQLINQSLLKVGFPKLLVGADTR